MLDRKEQERRVGGRTAHRLSVISSEGGRSFVCLFLFFFHITDRTAESGRCDWQVKVRERRRCKSLVLRLDPLTWSPKCKLPNRKQTPEGDQRKGCRFISQSARSSPLAGQRNQRLSRKQPAPAPPPSPACLPLQDKRFTTLKGSSLLTD